MASSNSLRRTLLHVRFWPVAVSVLVAVALTGVAAALSLDARLSAGDRARESAGNLVKVIGQDIARNIEMLSLSLQAVVDGVARPDVMALPPDLRRLALFDRSATATNLGVLVVYDAEGVLTIDSLADAPRKIKPITDREFFQALRDRELGLYFSRPYVSRLLDRPVVGLSRRITHADGSFGGIAHATIELVYLKNMLAALSLAPGSVVTLVRSDGAVIVRYADGEIEIGGDLSRSATFQRMRELSAGTFWAEEDGVERLYSFEPVGTMPLLLSVSVSAESIYGGWRQKAEIAAAGILLICVVLVSFTVLLTRELSRRYQAERDLTDANAELARLSTTDPLTQIGNRRSFDTALRRESRRAGQSWPLCLILVDVDYFKRFNDAYGHVRGDEALVGIAQVLAAAAIAADGSAFRIGGEEFGLVLPRKDLRFAVRLAEAIRLEVRARKLPHAASPFGTVTVSLGLTELRGERPIEAIARCDTALYDAKHRGRDRHAVSEPERLAA